MTESQFFGLMILFLVIAGYSYGLGFMVGVLNERGRISEALRTQAKEELE